MPSWRQYIKSSFYGRVFHLIHFEILQEMMNSVVFLKIHFQTGFFHFNGFINIGFQDGFHLNYFSNIGEPNLAPRLRILPSLFRIPLASFNKAPLKNKSAQYSLNPFIKTMLLF